jgi:fumarate hydratase subunit beta
LKHILDTPVSTSKIKELKVGDQVYINGIIYTARDQAHKRALRYEKKGLELPIDFANSIVFHCGPLVKKTPEGWKIVAIGPTTSSRMNSVTPEFIRKFGIKGIIGKGGMSKNVISAMHSNSVVYLAMTGGCAVLFAEKVKKVISVHWLDLGVPEALWVLEVRNFGPLIVAIDTYLNSLYELS